MSSHDATTVPVATGKAPDLLAAASTARTAAPQDLPRLVMRLALVVAAAFLLLSLGLGLAAARSDTRAEISGALALARMEQQMRELPADDAAALDSLRHLGELRHVRLRISDADGRMLLGADEPPPSASLRWLMQATLGRNAESAQQTVSWPVQRANARSWTATLVASPESEQREALSNLLGLFALLSASSLLMLAAMQWNVRRAFRPLQAMLGAIARIERQDLAGVQALPNMPIRELEAISGALKQLASSLEQAEEARRVLSDKILSLQEDERQRMARDLHDEFGQRLTALRVDAAWLQKRLSGDADAARVVAGMNDQIAHIQRDVRDMLARLHPLAGAAGETDSAARLASLLDGLASSWSRSNAGGLRCEARVARATQVVPDAPGPGAAAETAALAALRLPRAVVLALYRISQEAFTNAVRHGGARHALVRVEIDDSRPAAVVLEWSASDDGQGLQQPESALQRGNGLAGIKERVWALDGEFGWTPANPPPMCGLHLRARLSWSRTAVAR
jgi:two-component system sensor histidine kinase UhpB